MKSRDQSKFEFDLQKGKEAKEQGIALATAPLTRQQLLEIARETAVKIARERGGVTSDDVFRALMAEGLNPLDLGSAAGCVFRDRRFVFSGQWRKSQRVSNHASDLRVWRLA